MAVLNKNLAGSFGNGGFFANDNPNVWKAKSEGALLSEKAYGNPQMNPTAASKLADQTFKGDPWYALGKMIGAGYMQNYNERGINKKSEAADAAIQKVIGNPLEVDQQQAQPQTPQAVEQPIQQSDNVRSNWSSGYTPRTDTTNPVVAPRDKMAMEKREYFVDKYSNSPNPTSDGIDKANAEAQAKAQAQRIDSYRNIDPAMLIAIGDKEIDNMGGSQYQKDMAKARLREKVGGYMSTINKQIFDYDSKEVEDLINKGEYEKANYKYASLAARDKDKADMLFRGVPTLQQIWANKNRQAEMAARMSYGGGPRYSSKQQQPTTYAKQMWDQYGGMYKTLIGKKDLTDSEKAFRDNLTSIFSQDPLIVGMLNNQMRKNSWDIVSDYNKTGDYIREMKAKGMSDADIKKNLNVMAGLSPDNNNPEETVYQFAENHGLLLGGPPPTNEVKSNNDAPVVAPSSSIGISNNINYIPDDDSLEEDDDNYNRGKKSQEEATKNWLDKTYGRNPRSSSF